MTTNTDTARDQAQAQLESIQAMVARLEHAQSNCTDWEECKDLDDDDLTGTDSRNSEQYHDEDKARERIQEDPLGIQVRSDWVNVGEVHTPAEYEILLCTGGPAVRIIGELGKYGQPTRARLQYQDWGTPWTDYIVPGTMDTLISYAHNFYFGE